MIICIIILLSLYVFSFEVKKANIVHEGKNKKNKEQSTRIALLLTSI